VGRKGRKDEKAKRVKEVGEERKGRWAKSTRECARKRKRKGRRGRISNSLEREKRGRKTHGNGELDTLALGEGDDSLVALTDNEDVGETGGELGVGNVADGDDVVAAEVTLTVNDGTDTALVTTTGEHDEVALLELDVVDDLVLDEVELDNVVNLDDGVGVTDGATVVGDDEGDTLSTELDLADLEELVGSLLLGDAVDGEATLDIVEETEVLAGLLDGDNVYEGVAAKGGEGREGGKGKGRKKKRKEDAPGLVAVTRRVQHNGCCVQVGGLCPT
jgi:hypothetical protein